MNQIKKWCVYCHTCIPNGKKYVGITCQKPETRWGRGKGYKAKSAMGCAIKKYGWESFAHDILSTGLSAEQAASEERRLIALFNSIHPNGYNLDNGGNLNKAVSDETRKRIGDAHRNPSQEIRNKISNSRKGQYAGEKNHMYGKHLSEEAKTKMREKKIGKHLSAETKAKIGYASKNRSPEIRKKVGDSLRGEKHFRYGKHLSEEMRKKISRALMGKYVGGKNPHAKSVSQFDITGNLIKDYDSIIDAARETGVNHSNISRCCREKGKSAGGFVWEYSQ